ncbi:MAG: sodium:calcium antiporter [Planctomycetota bacterium]|nr:sodium:calcium antiporter [Planctomycetaceae bacterium]MDQ3329451.1 sodium:calcium antiporter [Planctomycetota bacterium]
MDFSTFPLLANVAVFAVAAAGVWFCGSYLSAFADLIAERTGLGKAFAGVLLLGTATSLPEIATTITASLGGNASLAGANLLGGVAMQVAILAMIDAVALRGRALTFFSPRPALIMQGVLMILLTALVGGAIASREFAAIGWFGAWSAILGVSYLAALYVIYRYEGSSRWEPTGEVAEPPQSAVDLKDEAGRRYADQPASRIWTYFTLCCVGVLITGWLVASTGEAIAEQTGLGSSFVGATLVALATSLPEVSTTYSAVRMGAYSMAVGNIFGTNCLTVALFPLADLCYRDGPIFNALDPTAGFLATLGIVVTCAYVWGILERRDRTVLGMGQDSAAVLLIYTGGMAIYFFIGP